MEKVSALSPNFKLFVVCVFSGMVFGFLALMANEKANNAHSYCLEQGNSLNVCHGAYE